MASGGYTVKLSPRTHISESCYCPHCKLLLKNAVQTGDGDRLCESCFKTIVDMPDHACKECGIKVDPREHYPDFASRKEISKVNVLCHNTDQGCGWSGQLKDMDAHLEECGYKKVRCDLCHEGVLARYIEQHMANECPEQTINCGYCNARVISKELLEHYGVCKDYPEDCSYCQKKVPRSKMDNHLADDCTHTRCVCGDVVEREKRGEHLKDVNVLFDHLSNATPTVGQSEGVIVMQETLKEHTSELVECQKERRDIHRRLAKVEAEQLKQAAEVTGRPAWQSGPLESGPPAGKGVEQELNVVKAQLKRLTERLGLLESSKNYDITPLDREREMDAHLEECGYKKVRCDLCHEGVLARYIGQHMANECPERTVNCGNFSTKMSKAVKDFFQMKGDIKELSQMNNATFSRMCQIEVNQVDILCRLGTLEAECTQLDSKEEFGGSGMSVVDRLKCCGKQASVTSNFEPEWIITDVARKMHEMESSGAISISSPPFCTGQMRYKMCLHVCVNGGGVVGGSSYLSATLYFVIMNGDEHAFCGWRLGYKVSLILIDQERSKHLVQTFKPNPSPISSGFQLLKSEMNVALGCPQFCSLSVLTDTSYVKDDTMRIRVCCS